MQTNIQSFLLPEHSVRTSQTDAILVVKVFDSKSGQYIGAYSLLCVEERFSASPTHRRNKNFSREVEDYFYISDCWKKTDSRFKVSA